MEIFKSVPNIYVVQNDKLVRQIATVQEFTENDDHIYFKCAEVVPEFKRGYMCDLQNVFQIFDIDTYEAVGDITEITKDALLILIRKYSSMDSFTIFEYVFHKD